MYTLLLYLILSSKYVVFSELCNVHVGVPRWLFNSNVYRKNMIVSVLHSDLF
jgi:hypothetical protein